MKKSYLLLVFLVALATVACDDDEVSPTAHPLPVNPTTPVPPAGPDTSKPVIEFTEPATTTSFVIIENVMIRVKVVDNGGLEEVRVYLEDSTSNKELIASFKTADYASESDKSFDVMMYLYRKQIPLPQGAGIARYRMIVEAEDKSKNVSQNSFDFNLHAPDLGKEEFVEIGSRLKMGEYMDWMVYTVPKEPDASFGFALFLMVDKDYDFKISDAEWKKFAADFDLKDQALATWDGDSDGKLTDSEFIKGIIKLNFYSDWDVNKDSIIDSSEFVGGIFDRWDHNKDGLLTRSEYEERYFTYFLFE